MAVALLLSTVSVVAQTATADEPAVRHALIKAVQARLGVEAEVRLEKVKIVCGPASDLVAVPEPGSRLGRVVRFALRSASAPKSGDRTATIGYALAEVHAAAIHLEVGRVIARGSEVSSGDLAEIDGDLGSALLAPLPVIADAVGTHASRDLQIGEVVTAAMLRVQPLVRSGDVVRTRAIVGRVDVSGRAVAQQSGQRNERIKLINPDSRKSLTGTITGAGEVVIVHEI
ncbi:MAG: flagellar basal body P-ring formation chaperone FlgA [Acidobacteriota bacterium]